LIESAVGTPVYHGPFAEYCQRFIDQKRALGLKYRTEEQLLRNFDRYTSQKYPDATQLTEELLNGWACVHPNDRGDKSSRNRFTVIRQFALFVIRCGEPAYVPDSCKPLSRSFVPHIFTHQQIKSILHVVDKWAYESRRTDIFKVLPVLFRVLYGCGLRVSEALNLKIRNIDWDKNTLLIQDAKFGKERLLPMSDSLASICQTFYLNHCRDYGQEDLLFRAENGTGYSGRRIYHYFRLILRECGIPHRGKAQGPRIHDFRHTMAVHCLEQWTKRGIDVYAALPALCAYLGHSTLTSTSRYVRLTAEVFPDILELVENYFSAYQEEDVS